MYSRKTRFRNSWLLRKYLVLILVMLKFAVCLLPNYSFAASKSFEMVRSDGSTLYWKIDRPDADIKVPIIVLVQGSGCLSVDSNENIAIVRSAFQDFAALTCEKYGVKPGDTPQDDHTDCSADFYENHTMTQRVNDYTKIIEALHGESWWNGQLVLFGGSEGGDVVARLAVRIKADAIIMLSVGGGQTFGEMVRQSILDEMERYSVPPERWPPIDEVFDKVRANSQSSETFAGSSYRFWADAIDHRAVDSMLNAQGVFLLIHGGNDVSVPVSDARMTVDIFVKAGHSNLTYWEFSGYDHIMADAEGNSRLDDVLALVSIWVRQQLSH